MRTLPFQGAPCNTQIGPAKTKAAQTSDGPMCQIFGFLFQGHFTSQRASNSGGELGTLLGGIHRSLVAAVMFFCNRGGFLSHLINGSPVLVLEGNSDIPVLRMFRNRIGIELVVDEPTLLLELVVNRPQILADVIPVLVGHAGLNVDVDDAPNRTVIVVGA